MRLTLKRLLDYRDDRLDPTETKELGKILAEHPEAGKWLDQLDRVLWDGVSPEPTESAEPVVTIARYLENKLDPAAEAELEKQAFRNPALLLEITRCHQALGAPPPAVRRKNEEGIDDPEGNLLVWAGGRIDLEDLELDHLSTLSREKEVVVPVEYENPLARVEHHFLHKEQAASEKPNREDGRGGVWRLALVGFCLVGLSGLMGFWELSEGSTQYPGSLASSSKKEAPDGANTFAANTNQGVHFESRTNGESKDGFGVGKEKQKGGSRDTEKKNPGFASHSGRGPDFKTIPDRGTDTENEQSLLAKSAKGVNPSGESKSLAGGNPSGETVAFAGQVSVLATESTVLEGLPVLVWSKGQNPERRLPGESISWGKEILVPSGFVAALDSRAGWKVFALGLCPTIAGAEKPIGTRLRFEPGTEPNRPVLHLFEGQVEIHFGGNSGDGAKGIDLVLNGQKVSLKTVGKGKLVAEAVFRNSKSQEPDWILHILEGMVEMQAADGQSAVTMVAPPGLCLGKHIPSSGITLEKMSKIAPGFGASWWAAVPRSREFVAAASEILTGAGMEWTSPGKLNTILTQPSANLARKILLVELAAWLGFGDIALRQVGDSRSSMKELRSSALDVLAQSSRRDKLSWNRMFDSAAGTDLVPKELAASGELEVFRQIVESLGRGETLPSLVNRSLDLLADGKTIWVREAAYGYLREAVRPDQGPKYNPADNEKARKLTQASWIRLIRGDG